MANQNAHPAPTMASTLDDALTLRAQAEARFSLKAAKLPAMGNFADAAQLLHELQDIVLVMPICRQGGSYGNDFTQ